MKIGVFIARYSISGVPLAQLRLARALVSAGHQVDVVIGYCDPSLTVPQVPGVGTLLLDRPKARGMLLPLRHYLRRVRPDIVFSAEDHLNALVLLAAILAGSKARISGSSRVTPYEAYSSLPFSKRWLLKQFVRLVSWRADALTCVSRDMVEQYRRVFRSPRHVCVYNIVDDAGSRTRMEEALDDPWITERDCPLVVAAGSLQPWKGFADLIDAAALLRDRGRPFRLIILGDGPLRSELEQRIDRLRLGDRVRLLGHVDNPLKYFARADVFALSSHVEGMPNVLVEAMMCGCTPVAANCPTGPSEVLQDGRFGYLVETRNPAALADGIERGLDRPLPAEQLAEAVRPFAEKTVLERHFAVLGLVGAV